MDVADRVLRLPVCSWRTPLLAPENMYRAFPNTARNAWAPPSLRTIGLARSAAIIHSNIYNPDYVVVVDETLLHGVDVTAGLNPEGAVVINSAKSPEELRPLLHDYTGRVCTVDARSISERALGKYFPNTPMLAAIVKVSGVLEEEQFISDMQASFEHKFSTKPQVIAGNIEALTTTMKEVSVG